MQDFSPARGGSPPPARSPAPSLRHRVLGLVGALAATFLGFAALALWQVQKVAEREFASQLLGTTRALALAVDGEFGRAEALLEGLARMRSLREGDLEGFLAGARAAAETLGMPAVWVAGPDGLRMTSTAAAPAGLPAAEEAASAIRTGRTQVGDYVDGGDPGRPRVVVAVPVRDAVGGGPAPLSLGLVMPLETLSAALAANRLPPGWVAAVLDRRGTVAARTRGASEFVGRPATPDVLAAVARGGDAVVGRSTSLDGARTIVAYARGPASGYGVLIAAPADDFEARRRGVLLALLAAGAPLALLGALLALALARQVSAALRGLAASDPSAPRLREVEDLAAALEAERDLRDRVEARLRERTVWFEAAQQAARVGVWQRDLRGGESRWSAGLRRILGLPSSPDDADAGVPPDAWLGHVHPEDRDRAAHADGWPGDGEAAAPRRHEFRVVAAGGAVRWVRSQSVVEADAAGRPLRRIGAWIDVTERRELEEAREAALRQRDLLAREIHHRVRNSLQIVLSLLLLQARRVGPEAAAALRDAATRITTIAHVHRRLHEVSAELAGDLAGYLGALAGDLQRSHAAGERGGGLELALQPGVALPPDRLPTVGIVVAELVTNAQKYGAGFIRLSLARRGGTIEVAVQDGGSGFPDDFDPARSRGLGMRVATALARQLGGALAVDRAVPGGRVVLTIRDAG
jgi:two-component sensor histidine kinase/PAS domain-containing protein